MYQLPQSHFGHICLAMCVKYIVTINNGPSDKPHKHIAMVNFYNSVDPRERVNTEEHKANVHLIAAAPELLEACEALLRFNTELCEDINVSTNYPSAQKARVAIAKAKGK